MKNSKDDSEREFICPKCRNHGGVSQEVKLDRGGLLSLSAGRYRAVSCGLCGYTEFYNLAVFEKVDEEAPVPVRLAEKVE